MTANMSMQLPDFSKKRAALRPQKIAFEDLHSGQTRTYAQIDEHAAKLANWLTELNIKKGDRVAVLCRNRIEFFELLFACAKSGAILVPLNWRMPVAEVAPILNDCNAKVLFYGQEDKSTAHALLSNDCKGVYFDAPDFEQEMQNKSPLNACDIWSGSDIWYLLYTSGTTGKPKAVIQTFQMALINAINIGQAINISSEDRTLNFLPLFHTAGINLYTIPTFLNGGLSKLLDGFDVDKVCALLSEGQIDTFLAVPAVYQAIAQHPDFENFDFSLVRSFACGGAPLPDVLIEKFANKGALICNGMGMTETGPSLFLMDKESVTKKIGSVGKPQLLSEVRIIDASGRPVNIGEDGELEVFSTGNTPGYFNNPEETAKAFTKDGWLKTGDIARQDQDGYFYIVGRSKEMFITGGENVYPAEVENVLAKHPAIIEAAVIGVKNEQWGEVGHAYIILREEQEFDHESFTAFCRSHLAPYKVPKLFSAVNDFPRTAAGKVRKHLLTSGEDKQ